MKQINTVLTILFLAATSFITAKAQSDFKAGFVVLASGDTLNGLVDYRASLLSSKACKFKSNETSGAVTYSPNQLKGYGFPGDRYYASKYLKQDSTAVFMELLLRSKINLYNLHGAFYVEKEELGLEELVIDFKEYYNEEGMLFKSRTNQHIGTLNKYMQDCIQMIEKIERVTLTQSSLIRLIKDYNACWPGQPVEVFKEAKPWLTAEIGVALGISHTSLSFSATDEAYLHLEHSNFGTSTYPVAGLMLNLRSPRVSKYTSLQLETHYFETSYEDQNSYDWFGTNYANEMKLNLAAVKLNIALRHEFSSKALQPYANAGMAFNFYRDSGIKHTQYVMRTAESTPEVRVKDNPEFITNRQNGLMAGAGFMYSFLKSKISAELRYEYGLDIHNQRRINSLTSYLNSNTSTVSFITGYYF